MAKYLIWRPTPLRAREGCSAMRGTKRRQAAEAAIKSAGGTMEQFYFAFGDHDAYVIIDAPDIAAVTAASMAINATGAVQAKTVVLITPEEVDQATKKSVAYRAPRH